MTVFKKLNKLQTTVKIKALKALNKDGKALVHMATGTGKTETAMKIYESFAKQGKRMLWLTHKNDLVEQILMLNLKTYS